MRASRQYRHKKAPAFAEANVYRKACGGFSPLRPERRKPTGFRGNANISGTAAPAAPNGAEEAE